jgi:glycosyltransferase involved in cell wall biosynthesis
VSVKVSVCITSYNQEKYLIEAIESVLDQSLMPFEIIIVDDCSADCSKEVIENYTKRYPRIIRPFYNAQNLGIPLTKSFCFENVKGDLVTLLDGDDRFLPRKLEKEVEMLSKNQGTDIVFSNVFYIDENGRRIGVWCNDNDIIGNAKNIFHEVFAQNSPFWSYRNELINYNSLKKIGFYDSELPLYHDWDLRIRESKFLKITYCPELLAEYRKHPGGIHRSHLSLHFKDLNNIYSKNRTLLNDLPRPDYKFLKNKMKINLALHANRTAREELEKGNKREAFKYWLKSVQLHRRYLDIKLVVQLILPSGLAKRLKNLYDLQKYGSSRTGTPL